MYYFLFELLQTQKWIIHLQMLAIFNIPELLACYLKVT